MNGKGEMQSGPKGKNPGFGDPSKWWETEGLGARLASAPQKNKWFGWKGKRLRPEKESRRGWLLAPAYSLHLCPQVLLQEQGWQRLEELRNQQRSQALVNLHRGFRTCISRQRVLPRMQARMRGFQARCASIGATAEVGGVRLWAHPPGGGAGLGKHSASGQVILPQCHPIGM